MGTHKIKERRCDPFEQMQQLLQVPIDNHNKDSVFIGLIMRVILFLWLRNVYDRIR